MAAFEEFVHVEHSSALSFEQSAGKLCCVNPVRTRAVGRTLEALRKSGDKHAFARVRRNHAHAWMFGYRVAVDPHGQI
jgi:hypothetical protein